MIDERVERKNVVTLAKGAGVSFVGSLAGAGLSFAFTLVAARGLGSHLFGVFALGIAIVELLGLVALLGLRRGVIRYVALYRSAGDAARERGTVLLAALIIGSVATLAAAALFVLADPISARFPDQTQLGSLLRLLAVAIPLSALTTAFVGATDGQKRMEYRVLVTDVVQPIALVAVSLVLLMLGWQLWGVAAAYVLSAGLALAPALYFVRSYFFGQAGYRVAPQFEARQLLLFSMPLFLLNVINKISGRLEIYLLGLLKASEAAGIFNVAMRTAALGLLAQGALISIVAPMAADLHHQGRKQELEHLLQVATKWSVLLNIPVVMLTILFAPSILAMFGQDFAAGATSLIILAAAQLVSAAAGPVGITLTMVGWPAVNLANSIGTLALNLALDLWLIPRFGLVGAALGSGLALSANNIAGALEVYYLVGVRSVSRKLVKPLVAALLAAIGSRFVLGLVPLSADEPTLLVAGLPLFLLLYGLALFGLGFDAEDQMVFGAVRKKANATAHRLRPRAGPHSAS